MMTPEANPPRAETLAAMQRLLAEARPDQIRRLLRDIMSDHGDAPERRPS